MGNKTVSSHGQLPLSPHLTFVDTKVEPAETEFVVEFDAWATRKHPRARKMLVKVLARTKRGALRIMKDLWPRADGHRVLSQTPLGSKAT